MAGRIVVSRRGVLRLVVPAAAAMARIRVETAFRNPVASEGKSISWALRPAYG